MFVVFNWRWFAVSSGCFISSSSPKLATLALTHAPFSFSFPVSIFFTTLVMDFFIYFYSFSGAGLFASMA